MSDGPTLVAARTARMLRSALGPLLADLLRAPDIVEILLNPDGRLWVDHLFAGLADTGHRLSTADGERIIRLVASCAGEEVHAGHPTISAELPVDADGQGGERFEGLLPPVVTGPTFAIRKPVAMGQGLDEYVAARVMTARQAATLRAAVAERWNILIAGGTGTGKTTLANALLRELAQTGDRIILIEDRRELRCDVPNVVPLRTRPGVMGIGDLVRASLALRPDRIPVGEVRGREALDLLKAWGTGHPGGIATLHAGSAPGALRRLEQLVQEAVVTVPRPLIAETIDLIAVLAGRGPQRRLAGLWRVAGLTGDDGYALEPLGAGPLALPTPHPSGDPS